MKLSAFEKMAVAILSELLTDSKRSKAFRKQLVQLARSIIAIFPEDFTEDGAMKGKRS